MTIPSFDFVPEFFIDETATRSFRVGLVVAASNDFRARVKYADVALPETGVVETFVVAGERQEGKPLTFVVRLAVSGITAPVDIGTLTYVGEFDITDATLGDVVEELTSSVQQAFFSALRGQAPTQAVVVRTATAKRAEPAPKKSWRDTFLNKKVGIGTGVLAAALIGVGVVQYQKSQDPLQRALASDNYKDIQAQIRERIAAAGKEGGAFSPLQGQNVAIETMKSMGLDPGKANTGCLVGVKQ